VTTVRRLQSPWLLEEGQASYVVRTSNGFLISTTYFDDKEIRDFMLRKEEARRVAMAISRLPDLLTLERAVRAEPGGEDEVD
jgi:hypothetical protein